MGRVAIVLAVAITSFLVSAPEAWAISAGRSVEYQEWGR